MLRIDAVHHVAIICSNYDKSRDFYTRILGLAVIGEHYREERQSWKCDLAINGSYTIELFSFNNPPARPTQPEACGLRHLAFSTRDIDGSIAWLRANGVDPEPVRIDPYTKKKFTFFKDPDDLPLELYEP